MQTMDTHLRGYDENKKNNVRVGFAHPITEKTVIPTVVEESVENGNRCLDKLDMTK
jgi:hypothetical protein